MGRTLTILAAGLILLGAVALVWPTFGFATFAGDRGVQVSTASDAAAYLGMEETNNDVSNPNEVSDIARLSNNLDSRMDVNVDVTFTDTDLLESDAPGEILPGDSEPVTAECAEGVGGRPGDASGETGVVVTVERAVAGDVTITDASLEFELSYDCHRGGGGGGGGGPPGGSPPGQSATETDEGTATETDEGTVSTDAENESATRAMDETGDRFERGLRPPPPNANRF